MVDASIRGFVQWLLAMTKRPETPHPQPGDTTGDRFARLVQIMRTLRSPDGCAWDREQTVASLRPFVLEEAYEVVDAIDRGDRTALCDEIGDLLLEAVFVAQICAEAGEFTIADATDAVVAKLVRRHPHVFGGSDTGTDAGRRDLSPAEVKEQWERIKTRERAGTPTRANPARRHPRRATVPAAGVSDRRAHRECRVRLGRAGRGHRQGR